MPGYERWVRELRKRRERVTPAQIAEALGVSPATVCAWMRDGLIRYSVGKRGFPLIRKAAVKRALQHERVAMAVAAAERKRAVWQLLDEAPPMPSRRFRTGLKHFGRYE